LNVKLVLDIKKMYKWCWKKLVKENVKQDGIRNENIGKWFVQNYLGKGCGPVLWGYRKSCKGKGTKKEAINRNNWWRKWELVLEKE